MAEKKRLAVIRIRGKIHRNYRIKSTFDLLRLGHKNHCAVVPNNPSYTGMLKKVKDYVTWGEINDDTFNLLVEKRGEEFKCRETDSKKKIKYDDFFVVDGKKLKKCFRLDSPRKGFGRKGLKSSFKNGGALGYRGDNINDLIRRML